ncbi:MAG: hypothetical protein NTV46_17215 [Verrucomicrobia bacterium]|nr:hypothetical protein [Verrucomicrobiota bacterium]
MSIHTKKPLRALPVSINSFLARLPGLAVGVPVIVALAVAAQAEPTSLSRPQAAAARIDANQNVILENQNLRMVFERNQDGYTAAVVSVHDGKS